MAVNGRSLCSRLNRGQLMRLHDATEEEDTDGQVCPGPAVPTPRPRKSFRALKLYFEEGQGSCQMKEAKSWTAIAMAASLSNIIYNRERERKREHQPPGSPHAYTWPPGLRPSASRKAR